MKKFIILLFSIFLAMSLAACGNKTDSRDSSEKTEIKDAKELLTTVWNSYEEEGKPVSMLADYTKMMTQYSEFAAAMAEYESEELSDADAAYLIQVNARVQAKLLTLN